MKSFGAGATGARLERMRASAQWVERAGDAARPGTAGSGGFRNPLPQRPGLRDPDPAARPTLAQFLRGGERRAPGAPLPLVDPREAWRQPLGTGGLRATWLGHSTMLLEFGRGTQVRRVLTDPVWGARASPSRLVGPRRFHPAPVPIAALPPLDAVIVSHDHYDHLCMASVRELARRQPAVPFVTSLGVGAHLEAFGVEARRIVELDWWESHLVPGAGLRLTAAPAQHFSGRGLKDRNATLWSSFVLADERDHHHGGAGARVFFSGDTGLTDQYTLIRQRFGTVRRPFDLVLLEVGAWHPSWGDIHLGPRHALEALALLGGGAFLPVHWSTFALAMHAWDEPAETLIELAPRAGVHLVMPRLGEAVEPAAADGVRPWWRGIDHRAASRTPGAPGVGEAAGADVPAELLRWPKALPFPLD